jgi:hypothetical protein
MQVYIHVLAFQELSLKAVMHVTYMACAKIEMLSHTSLNIFLFKQVIF